MEDVRKVRGDIKLLGPVAQALADARKKYGRLFLHVGCGPVLVPGWVNCDVLTHVDKRGTRTAPGMLYILNRKVYAHLDPTQPYPIDDGAIALIYSEAFIEHLTLRQAVRWLHEMSRILRRGGRIRLTTPDLAAFCRAFLDPKQELFTRWRLELLEHGASNGRIKRPAFLFNMLMHEWGHQYLYDFPELGKVLHWVGFRHIAKREFRTGHERLAALDQEWRRTGNLYVEAVKP